MKRSRYEQFGGWLFRRRTLIPLPLAIAVLGIPSRGPVRTWLIASGVLLTLAGEALRLWGVHHIGVISRTRSGRLGPLIDTGPFAIVRNPLYLGNIALWAGFALTAQLVWLAVAIVVLLAGEYQAIVRWEEHLLEDRLGDSYREYAAHVPRWIPKSLAGTRTTRSKLDRGRIFSWRETIFSERGTLVAMALGYVLLWLKLQT